MRVHKGWLRAGCYTLHRVVRPSLVPLSTNKINVRLNEVIYVVESTCWICLLSHTFFSRKKNKKSEGQRILHASDDECHSSMDVRVHGSHSILDYCTGAGHTYKTNVIYLDIPMMTHSVLLS